MTEAEMRAILPAKLELVWETVTDLTRWDWRTDLKALRVLPDGRFQEIPQNGPATMFTITRLEPMACYQFNMENDNIRGSWTGVFRPVPEGTEIVFTERVSPKKWWMAPFVKGYLKQQQSRYLADLRRGLGLD